MAGGETFDEPLGCPPTKALRPVAEPPTVRPWRTLPVRAKARVETPDVDPPHGRYAGSKAATRWTAERTVTGGPEAVRWR